MAARSDKRSRSFSSIYIKLGNRMGQRLFDEVSSTPSLAPKMTAPRLLAYVVAGAIHTLTLAFAGLGLWLIVAGWPNVFEVAGGALCLVLAWLVRPKPLRLTRRVEPRADFPVLFDLMDRVAIATDAKPVQFLLFNGDYSAGFARVGWRLRPAIRLGIPQLVSLDPQERVALLGHELGHGVNGNPARTLFVGSALDALTTWYGVVYPLAPRRTSYEGGIDVFVRLAAIIAYPFARVLAYLILLVARVLIHLLWQDGQRAEYLADELAAKVGGTPAALGMLRKNKLAVAYRDIVQHASLNRKTGVFDEMRARAAAGSEGGWGEIPSSLEGRGGFRLDATHPPDAYRIRLLQSRLAVRPEVLVSASDNARIDAELAKVEQRIEREILDRHRASLYR